MADTISHELKIKIERAVAEAIEQKTFPGVEILLARSDTILFHQAFGHLTHSADSPRLEKNACFDLASLTKPIATAAAVLQLVEAGSIKLNTGIRELLPELSPSPFKDITITQLLTHTSGLPAWAPLYEPDFNRHQGWKKLCALPPQCRPNREVIYSCLGFILLGEVVRRCSSLTLTDFCRRYLFLPLKLNRLTFNPDPSLPDIVPTAYCPFRGQLLRGIVHDENAYLFEGEGGNAGLFGTALEIYRFCRLLWQGGQLDGVRLFQPDTVRRFLNNQTSPPLEPRGWGWDYHTGDAEYMSCGTRIPAGSLGHLGFTGTSLWMHPETETIVIILSNRVNITREENIPLMRAFRPKMHDLLLSELFG